MARTKRNGRQKGNLQTGDPKQKIEVIWEYDSSADSQALDQAYGMILRKILSEERSSHFQANADYPGLGPEDLRLLDLP